ncbi:DNA-binding transcriptional MerR regulator [Kribbella antiqua]|uniref:DNA-binding transcriptional MerR regulator n=1 Tax=Kribbella antiqua TaxID=2512217 RepID=A0A4R2J7W1_9ACTN|nr:MerR family transcriptional regulator [Kribbella antiqua]TCO52029.1 DNA-binding transcriptional MerR regulator [Kribbella antiqua]
MFAIGEFARHGRVSIRMLRHYDAIGLLRPARVDPVTGYRSYDAGQFADLNRIVALKDLGFSLEQVRTMIADEVSPAELRALLTMRRAELESTVAESYARLAQVESRLRGIESALPTADVVVKDLPAIRLVGLTTTAASFTPEDIGPVVQPLCAELGRRLPDAAVQPAGRLTCLYERSRHTEDEVVVRATVPASVDAEGNLNGLEVVDLPAVRAATLVHRGPIDQVLPAWQALARWIDDNGHQSSEPARELYLDCPEDPASWVTELQEPIGP